MKLTPDYVKPCYRCERPVRMTREQFEASADEHTCCAICRVVLSAEAAAVFAKPISQTTQD